MDFKKQYLQGFQVCKRLVTEPRQFWRDSLAEGFGYPVVRRIFVPAVFLVALAVFIGDWLTDSEFLLSYAFLKAMRELFSYLLQFYLVVLLLTSVLKNMGRPKARQQIEYLLAYSMVPFLAASFITGLFPALYVLGVFGLYGFYLLVVGIQETLSLPKESQSRFVFLAVLLIILIFAIVNIVSWKLLMAFFPYGA